MDWIRNAKAVIIIRRMGRHPSMSNLHRDAALKGGEHPIRIRSSLLSGRGVKDSFNGFQAPVQAVEPSIDPTCV